MSTPIDDTDWEDDPIPPDPNARRLTMWDRCMRWTQPAPGGPGHWVMDINALDGGGGGSGYRRPMSPLEAWTPELAARQAEWEARHQAENAAWRKAEDEREAAIAAGEPFCRACARWGSTAMASCTRASCWSRDHGPAYAAPSTEDLL